MYRFNSSSECFYSLSSKQYVFSELMSLPRDRAHTWSQNSMVPKKGPVRACQRLFADVGLDCILKASTQRWWNKRLALASNVT